MTFTIEEKVDAMKRRKQIKNTEIARHLGKSAAYVGRLLKGQEIGPAAEANFEAVKKYIESK